jgi:drug/metabolite transporter (DMT)-like permease
VAAGAGLWRRYGVQLALVGVAAVWGATFVIVKDAVSVYPLYAFLGLRFAIAVVAFIVLFPRVLKRLDSGSVKMGLFAGVFLTAGYVFQTWGLQDTTPARAAFITGLYVIVTPLLQAALLRRRPHGATIGGAAIALGGLWLLSGAGSGLWSAGDTRTVFCALAYSVHFIVLGSTKEHHDISALTLVQLATAAVICGAVSLVTEHAGLPTQTSVWFALFMTGVLASAAAFAIQTWAQRQVSPARTALILASEPAFGGLFGWAVAGVAPIREVVGAAMMLGGMILSEVVAALAPKEEGIAFGPAVEGMPAPVIEEPVGESSGDD